MSSRGTSWLAWSLATLSVVMFVGSVVLWVLAHSIHVPRSLDADLTTGGLLGQALFLVFPLVGALIASRRPENPIGWLCLVDGLLWTTTNMLDYHSLYVMASPGSVPFPVVLAGVNHWLWVPTVGLLGTYVFLLFPDGRLPSRRWGPLAWLSGVVIFLQSAAEGLAPGPLENQGGVRNPFGIEALPWLANAALILLPLLPLCILASAVSMVLRFRRSRGEVRQQIKWIAFAASLVALTYLIAIVASFIHPSEIWFAAGLPLWLDLIEYAALLSITSVPIAIGFAVLKYRLYDIDLIINRTLVYGSLTGALALVYFGGVTVTQALFRNITGQEQLPQLVIVASTLVIAALFNPLRRRIQSFIDRRFYRSKYDARKILEAFSVRLRDETDLEALNKDLVGVVRETMQPAHVSLWLRPEKASKGAQID